MRSLIRLELLKQQKTFLGLMLIIVFSLSLVTSSVSIFADLPFGETFLLVTVILQAIGIPFFALLVGGSSAAALRSHDRKAEEEVPVRPIKRVLAAYLVSLIYLSIPAAVLFLVSIPNPYSAAVQGSFIVPFIMMMLLPLHSSAFVFSYWLGQGLLGSLIVVMATGGPAYWLLLNLHLLSTSLRDLPGVLIWIVSAVFFPFWILGGTDFILFAVQSLPQFVATAGHLILLVWIVHRIEREACTWLPAKTVVAILLFGSLPFAMWGFFGNGFLVRPESGYGYSVYLG